MSALPLIPEEESVAVPVVVEFLEEDGVYMVTVPWLQGCRAWGIPWTKLCGRSLTISAPWFKPVTHMLTLSRNLSRTWISAFPSPCGSPYLGIDPQEFQNRG